jgi:hypothetical protein
MTKSLHAKERKSWLPPDLYGMAEYMFLHALECTIPVVEMYRQVPPPGQDET